MLLASAIQHGDDKLKVESTLGKVESADRLGLLNESQRPLGVRAKGIPREVKVHQRDLHVLVLFHTVGQQ